MTINEAIKEADDLRPNALKLSYKLRWLQELDRDIANMMGVDYEETSIYNYEGERELLMPAPYESVYVYHLMAEIDMAIEDSDKFVNDSTIANQKLAEAKAWYRRNHRSKDYIIGGVFH